MKVINVTNILTDGSINIHNTDRDISLDEFESKYRHFQIQPDDIVIASSGNTYGKIGRIRAEHLPLMMNTSVIRFHSLDSAVLNDEYLYGFLRSSLFRNQIESFVIGSAQPNFGPSHLKQMQIPLPPLETQRRIAAILSAYDDLIENNTRRIKALEQAAHDLYREWFVHFRFPGHESVDMVDSGTEYGMIPHGWEVGRLGDTIELAYGKSLPKRVRVPGDYRVYGSSGFVDTRRISCRRAGGYCWAQRQRRHYFLVRCQFLSYRHGFLCRDRPQLAICLLQLAASEFS